MKILVIHSQYGRICKNIIKQIKSKLTDSKIIAVGINFTSTFNMIKSRANIIATGENSIVIPSKKIVAKINAINILFPVSKYQTYISELKDNPFSKYIDNDIKLIKSKYYKLKAEICIFQSFYIPKNKLAYRSVS